MSSDIKPDDTLLEFMDVVFSWGEHLSKTMTLVKGDGTVWIDWGEIEKAAVSNDSTARGHALLMIAIRDGTYKTLNPQ